MTRLTIIEKLETIVNLICEDSAPDFISSLPVYVCSQAKNIPDHELEDFAIGSDEKRREIAELYDAIELHAALNDFFCNKKI